MRPVAVTNQHLETCELLRTASPSIFPTGLRAPIGASGKFPSHVNSAAFRG